MTTQSAPPSGSISLPDPSHQRYDPWLKGALATLVVSSLCVLPVAIPSLPHLSAPWGAGDMTYFYFMASTWNWVSHGATTQVAFPFGMDPNAFAGLDGLTYLVANLLSWVFGNSYIGLNLLLLLSFPIVALLAFSAIRLVGLRGPLAVALACAFTCIPFHFGRGIGHIHLGLMFGLATGVILALLIGSGRLTAWFAPEARFNKVRRSLLLLLLICITSWTGLYYAFFGLVLVGAAIIWRISGGDRWQELKWAIFTALGLTTAIGVGLIPVLLSRVNSPDAAVVALREASDTVTYAGNLAIALVPQPYSIISQAYNDAVFEMFSIAPANEAHLMANFGSWVTTASVLVFLVGLVTWRRTQFRFAPNPERRTGSQGAPTAPITYIAYLLIVIVSLFVPWGLNYLFSYFATAQIRAWNRLLPYILLLVILGAAAALASWKWPRRSPLGLITSMVLIIVVVVDMVLPWRNLYTDLPKLGTVRVDEASAYSRQVNATLSKNCGVLTLPFIAYPEAGPVQAMDDYDHFTLVLANPQRPISYGAFTGTSAARELERISTQPLVQSAWELRSLGFCGVHVDTRGYPDSLPILRELTDLLGPPVARVGPWFMFSLET